MQAPLPLHRSEAGASEHDGTWSPDGNAKAKLSRRGAEFSKCTCQCPSLCSTKACLGPSNVTWIERLQSGPMRSCQAASTGESRFAFAPYATPRHRLSRLSSYTRISGNTRFGRDGCVPVLSACVFAAAESKRQHGAPRPYAGTRGAPMVSRLGVVTRSATRC